MPLLQLSDDEMQAVLTAARPIAADRRDAFLETILLRREDVNGASQPLPVASKAMAPLEETVKLTLGAATQT